MWWLALVWVASVVCGAYAAAQKRRPVMEGLAFGLLLGPLGVLTVACLPTGERPASPPFRGIADRVRSRSRG